MYSLQSSAFSLFHFIFMWQCREGHCQIPLPSVRVRFSVLDEDSEASAAAAAAAANFGGLVLGCMDSYDSNQILIL